MKKKDLEFQEQPSTKGLNPDRIRDDDIIWTEEYFDEQLSNAMKIVEREPKTYAKPIDRPNKWLPDLIMFLKLLIELILSIIKGNAYDPEALAEFCADLWIKYVDIKWIPNLLEKQIIKWIVKALVSVIIDLFKEKKIAILDTIKAGRLAA